MCVYINFFQVSIGFILEVLFSMLSRGFFFIIKFIVDDLNDFDLCGILRFLGFLIYFCFLIEFKLVVKDYCE